MKNAIAVFASGNGTNAERIAKYFSEHPDIRVKLIVCNNKNAYVIERARSLQLPCVFVSKAALNDSGYMTSLLKSHDISLIVLAGFLIKIPTFLTEAFNNRIVNIHPALLPKYGGKGMYGEHVHKAVIEAGEKESGITIHYVNACYDEGEIIFQAKVPVLLSDTPDSLAQKIHVLEYEHYPVIIEKLISAPCL
ncbi:MAG: Phosphoribosylglycinamide formyltransferase [Bacteroidetes bacterium ADurb.Bin408]|nr:MAG: Phosphoribosylglycinamide formyltransferase [Bacteroidetes bacterium ADurb.Bin408]